MSGMTSRVARRFQFEMLAQRVAQRHASTLAMEHPSDEARKTYLKDHPNADPSNHTVKKEGPGGGASSDVSKATSRGKETTKHFEDMKGLKTKVENGDSSARKKFDKAYEKLYESGEAAAKSAQGLLKKFENVDGKEAQAAVKLLHDAVKSWDQNKSGHHRATGAMAHGKMQQAEQTWAYAKKIDDQIEMLGKALKGDYD